MGLNKQKLKEHLNRLSLIIGIYFTVTVLSSLTTEVTIEGLSQQAVNFDLAERAESFFPEQLPEEVNITYVKRIGRVSVSSRESILSSTYTVGLHYAVCGCIFVAVDDYYGEPRPFGEIVHTLGHELGHHYWHTRMSYEQHRTVCEFQLNVTDYEACQEDFADEFADDMLSGLRKFYNLD